MYDVVTFECELPQEAQGFSGWQTKDFSNTLAHYKVTKEGRMIWYKTHYELVPEEQRPYYGKPEWEKEGFYQLAGSLRSVSDGEVDINCHGDFYVIGNKNEREFIELKVRFTHGVLEEITILSKQEF
jgi:hypothetical protein